MVCVEFDNDYWSNDDCSAYTYLTPFLASRCFFFLPAAGVASSKAESSSEIIEFSRSASSC